MTDEFKGNILEEAVILKSKMYSFKHSAGVKQGAKGVNRCVKKTLHHDLYRQTLMGCKSIRREITNIQSFRHRITTTTVNKKALCAFDDKRFLHADGIASTAHGHYRLNQTPPQRPPVVSALGPTDEEVEEDKPPQQQSNTLHNAKSTT
jgi:hypothetical protein